MKNLFRIILTIFIAHKIEASIPDQNNLNQDTPNQADPSQPSYSSQIFRSSTLTPTNKQSITSLTNTVQPYPLRGVIDEKIYYTKEFKAEKLKASVPTKVIPLLQASKLSILKPTTHQFNNYPSGGSLFPNYPKLSSQFDAMIKSFKSNPDFIPLFRKVHINVLNELYHYLIGIFMNFNLQHQGMIQNPTTHDLESDIPTYLQTEDEYDINKKTMIINHLMSIIESQFNGAIQSYVPYIPQSFATYVGRTAIQNDYSTDLTHLIIEQMEPELQQLKASSLQALVEYVTFFQSMTDYLDQKHPKANPHFSAFVDIAQQINTFLYADAQDNQARLDAMKAKSPTIYFDADTQGAEKIKTSKESANSWAKGMPYQPTAAPPATNNSYVIHNDAHLIALSKMNPPIFHFGYDDIRALKLIPYLAKKISPKAKKVPWPEQMIEAANKMILFNATDGLHPIAYFKKDNKMVRNINHNPAESDLYLCMRLGYNIFEQILIPEPDWLSSWSGIVQILRACYGDFTAILGMGILDPVTEAVIANVVKRQGGKEPESMAAIQQKAINLINSWKNINKKVTEQTDLPLLSLPPLSSLSNNALLNPSQLTPPLVSQP